MTSHVQEASPGSRLKWVLTFIMHQFLGTWGVGVFAYYLGTATLEVFKLFGLPHSMQPLYWILTENPFFPLQIALALYSGWYLARRLKHESMVWVWVIPGLILCCAILEMTAHRSSVFSRSGGSFSHYLGWGCQPKDHCIDQLLITMPFYAATAYSIGARLGLKRVDSGSLTLAG